MFFVISSIKLSFGSKTLTEQSKKAWRDFSKSLEVFKNSTIANNNKLIVLLSPISLQIPFHEKNNILNYDLNCASVQPNLLMKKMLDDLQIIYSDPLPLFVEVAQTDFNEENQTSLFIFNDTNHPNPKGHLLLAYSLIKEILDNLKSN